MPSSSPDKKGVASTGKGKIKYRKDPNAPKRFKSAFIFFSMEKHPEIRKRLEVSGEGKSEQTPTVAKIVSEAWRNLSPEERSTWDEKAREDKARYEVEKRMYSGPWKIPAVRRTKKNPSAPKRPMSAFLSFSQKYRKIVKHDNPQLSNTDISKLLAKMWREASEEERNGHIEREAKLRKAYTVAIAEWKVKHMEEMKQQREKREDMARSVLKNNTLCTDYEHDSYFSGESPASVDRYAHASNPEMQEPPERECFHSQENAYSRESYYPGSNRDYHAHNPDYYTYYRHRPYDYVQEPPTSTASYHSEDRSQFHSNFQHNYDYVHHAERQEGEEEYGMQHNYVHAQQHQHHQHYQYYTQNNQDLASRGEELYPYPI